MKKTAQFSNTKVYFNHLKNKDKIEIIFITAVAVVESRLFSVIRYSAKCLNRIKVVEDPSPFIQRAQFSSELEENVSMTTEISLRNYTRLVTI